MAAMTLASGRAEIKKCGAQQIYGRNGRECGCVENMPELGANQSAEREPGQQRQLKITHRASAQRGVSSGDIGDVRQQRRSDGSRPQAFNGPAQKEDTGPSAHPEDLRRNGAQQRATRH